MSVEAMASIPGVAAFLAHPDVHVVDRAAFLVRCGGPLCPGAWCHHY